MKGNAGWPRWVARAMAVVAVASTVGCATTGANYRPIVDTRGVNPYRYETDLRECQGYATQVAGAGDSAVAGAAAGALLGAALAAAGGRHYDRAGSARVGAVAGAVSAASQGEESQRNIVRRCMAGRGYSVLQ